MQRPPDFAARHGSIRLVCLFSRRVGGQLNDGVELRIHFGDLLEMGFDDPLGAEFLRPDGVGKLARRRQNDGVGGVARGARGIGDEILSGRHRSACQRYGAQKVASRDFVAHWRSNPDLVRRAQLISFLIGTQALR